MQNADWMRSRTLSALLAAPVLALVSCETPAAPLLVEGAERFDPPPASGLWWQMTQECSGRRGLPSRVRWYVVPGARTIVVQGRTVEGYWTAPGNTIVLAEAAVLEGALVRHEMLHSLYEVAGHTRDPFLERCAGVVLCDFVCESEAGPPPPHDASVPRVEPDALEVGLEVTPSAPSRARYGGHFALTITVRNPRSHPVVVSLPPPTVAAPKVSFQYRIDFAGTSQELVEHVGDPGVTRFAAGETKRRVFDFRIVGPGEPPVDGGLSPGVYQFSGAFGSRWAPHPATVSVPSP